MEAIGYAPSTISFEWCMGVWVLSFAPKAVAKVGKLIGMSCGIWGAYE
jgi:hypothetical protein